MQTQTKERNYVVSPVTVWDEESYSFQTKIGEKSKLYPLSFIACGSSERESREKAEHIVNLLKTNQNDL